VTLWQQSEAEDEKGWWKEVWNVDLPSTQIPESVHLFTIPGGGDAKIVVLAVGAVDGRIHVWSGLSIPSQGLQQDLLSRAGVLTGHQDWVRALDWTLVEGSTSKGLLASGSQDAKIRLWKVQLAASGALTGTSGWLCHVCSSSLVDFLHG